jgi:hypothetical protein
LERGCRNRQPLFLIGARLVEIFSRHLLNREPDGDPLLLRELLCHLALCDLRPVIDQGQVVDVGLGNLPIVDQPRGAGNRQPVIAVLDADRAARVTAQIAVFEAAAPGIHHDLVSLQLVPDRRLLRGAVGIDGCQDAEPVLLQELSSP